MPPLNLSRADRSFASIEMHHRRPARPANGILTYTRLPSSDRDGKTILAGRQGIRSSDLEAREMDPYTEIVQLASLRHQRCGSER